MDNEVVEEHSKNRSVELIDVEELEEALYRAVKWKTTRIDGVNSELIKYGYGSYLKYEYQSFLFW